MSGAAIELLGQQATIGRLVDTARRGRLHHCYLFEGPPSVGKHTAALQLAMAAACEGDERPCGSCPPCRQMAAGTHPDLLILSPDPKRKTPTIGVGQVRELVGKLRLRRYSARWRMVIVDPADGLMPQAANALLKTLEEPPDGTGFVLVTSRVSALLPTVLSRSQRIRFRAVPEVELVPWLQERGVDDAVRVARLSLGCPGRALALAEGELAQVDGARDELLRVLAEGPQAVFELAEKAGRGSDARQRTERLLGVLESLLRDATLFACGRPEALINADRPDLVAAWSQALWPEGIGRLQQRLDGARQQMQVNVNARLMLEALLSRLLMELGQAARRR